MRWQDLTWRGRRPSADATAIAIAAVGEQLGVRFSAAYVECAARHAGMSPHPSTFLYPDPVLGPTESSLGELLSFDLVGRTENIVTVNQWAELPPGIVAFATDGGGDLMCFDSGAAVVYWMHERAGEPGAIAALAPDFEAFISLLCQR